MAILKYKKTKPRNKNHKKSTEQHLAYLQLWIATGLMADWQRVNALVDTGCSIALQCPVKLLKELGVKINAPIRIDQAELANGDIEETPIYRLSAKLQMSNGEFVTIEDIEVAGSDTSDEIILGMGLIQFFDVTIRNNSVVNIQTEESIATLESYKGLIKKYDVKTKTWKAEKFPNAVKPSNGGPPKPAIGKAPQPIYLAKKLKRKKSKE